jgi:quercetin dioxygenase-like cupin family protein
MLKGILLCTALAAFTATPLFAQQASSPVQPSPIKRIPLQKVDVPGTNLETITGIAEIVPNVNIGRHTHAGIETGYVLEGELTLLVEGQPPKTMKVGDSYQIAAGAIHDARSGAARTRVLAVYVVEKGKPLASPVK